MKFMGGIDTFHFEGNGVRVNLPHHHRASTGLFSDTTIYLFPRITNENKFHEIVVTPFHPEDWANIWKLELSARDRPGLIKDITDILRHEKVNILILESLVTNYNLDSTISLIALFRDYFNKHEIEVKSKLTQEDLSKYHQQIKTIFDEFNKNLSDRKIELERFEPIRFLMNNSKEAFKGDVDNKINLVDRETLDFYYQNRYHGTTIKDKSILVDERLLMELDLKKYAGNSESIQGIIFSDTEDKFILVRFFSKDQLMVNLEVTYDVKPYGIINEFAKKIQEIDENFNLISYYNRIRNDQNTALSYILVDVTSNPQETQKLIDELRKIRQPSKVTQVKVINYSKSLLAAAEENFDLEESEEQKDLKFKKQSAEGKELTYLHELQKKSASALETLKRDKRQIEFHADREVKNKTISIAVLIIFFLILLITLVLMTTWDNLEPWVSITPIIFSGLATLYTLKRGFDYRFPSDNEKRKEIIKQWTEKKGYEIDGENSLDYQIAILEQEKDKYRTEISMIESKLLK